MTTGVYFHPLFKKGGWPILGAKFRDFPAVMEDILNSHDTELIEPKRPSEELVLKVHSVSYFESVKGQSYFEGAMLSVGGCVEACEKVMSGELKNALVFDVAAGHHAGPNYGWGGTYISATGPAVVNIREKYGDLNTAIIDIDSHHGDGTRAVFEYDSLTFHYCFCSSEHQDLENNNFCVKVGGQTNDTSYLDKMKNRLIPELDKFSPDIIILLLGHDTCYGDYGDRGLTPDFFPKAVQMIKEYADYNCQGRLVVVTMGGANPDLTNIIIPMSLKELAERR